MNNKYLKGLLVAKGKKIKEVAEEMNISRDALSKKLNGHTPYNLKDIKKLIQILDIPEEEVAKYFL